MIVMMGSLVKAGDIHNECMDNTHSTVDAVECALSYYDRLDATLDRLWQALLETYDEQDTQEPTYETNKILVAALHDERQAWEKYKEKACQFFAAHEEIDGTFVPIFGSMGKAYEFPACRGSVIEQRIEILRLQLCEFNDNELCD